VTGREWIGPYPVNVVATNSLPTDDFPSHLDGVGDADQGAVAPSKCYSI
jgi:hypothetical protein